MTVAAQSDIRSRFATASERLTAAWTANQFVTGVYRLFFHETPPYEIELDGLADLVRSVGGRLALLSETRADGAAANAMNAALAAVESEIADAVAAILDAERRIGPSQMRRFFEKAVRQDEQILEALLRFYLLAGPVEGDRRDKVDYLFTRLSEEFVPHRREYVVRDALPLRQRLIAITSIVESPLPAGAEEISLIRAIRSLREDIANAANLDEIAKRNLLRNARTFKHRVGHFYFHPDVLLAVMELNVAAKNRFSSLYDVEEPKLIEDADKLMEYGSAIERNFGDTNPELVRELARFRELRERFGALRAESNVKYDVVAGLKSSMSNILQQLDRGIRAEEGSEAPAFDRTATAALLTRRLGRNETLLDYLLAIGAALADAGSEDAAEEIARSGPARELRLEPWEAAAWQKLIGTRPGESEEDSEELWTVYVRAAALRIKIDAEATILATAAAAEVKPDAELLAQAKNSLEEAKQLDEQFGDLLQEAVYYSNRRILRQLYRSRFRLLRVFSGLWLVYDRST